MFFKKYIITIGFLIGLIFLLNTNLTASANFFEYPLLESIPFVGDSGNNINLAALVIGIYKLAIGIVGIAALFMLSVGGFYYMTSAGNASTASTAKGIITDSLLGLFIALVAWGLLFIINPDLVQNGAANPSIFQASTAPGGASLTVEPCFNCVPMDSSICKAPCEELTAPLAAKLTASNIPSFASGDAWVTEGYPPAVPHISSCHKIGTCADVNLKGPDRDNPTPEAVWKLYTEMQAAGLVVLYESTNCSKYTSVYPSINCKTYSTMNTNSSFHVYSGA